MTITFDQLGKCLMEAGHANLSIEGAMTAMQFIARLFESYGLTKDEAVAIAQTYPGRDDFDFGNVGDRFALVEYWYVEARKHAKSATVKPINRDPIVWRTR